VTYDFAIYALYPNAPCGLENITKPYCNLNGAPLAGVPRWAISAGAEYDEPVNIGPRAADVYAGIDYTYRSPLYSNAADSIYSHLPDLNLINLRLGVRLDSRTWDVYLWAKNIANANYFTFVASGVANTGLLTAQVGLERTFGGTVRFHF